MRGWESIEFKEMYQSACEYLGNEQVIRLVVSPDQDYIKQVSIMLRKKRITHYVYDPRTGSQDCLKGFWQSIRIAFLMQTFQITPIAILTDLSIRLWRSQAGIVTAKDGLAVCFMSARQMSPIFPHSRLLGPSLIPFSVKTRELLDELIQARTSVIQTKAIFTGSLYEPRTSILTEVQERVWALGGDFEILGRILGTSRVSDEAYWSRLVNAGVVFTTSVQMKQPGTDWDNIPNLIYRYLEVLASGSLLIAQEVPSVRRYFLPDQHFVAYENPQDAAEKIVFYLKNRVARDRIAQLGKAKADALINAGIFWLLIDSRLGKNSLY